MPWCSPETKQKAEWARDSLLSIARRWSAAQMHVVAVEVEVGKDPDASMIVMDAQCRARDLRRLMVWAQLRYQNMRKQILKETGFEPEPCAQEQELTDAQRE